VRISLRAAGDIVGFVSRKWGLRDPSPGVRVGSAKNHKRSKHIMLARFSQLHLSRRDNRDADIEVLKFLCPYSRERAEVTTVASFIYDGHR